MATSLGAPSTPLHRLTCGPPPAPAATALASLELTKCRSWIDTLDDEGSGKPDTLTDNPSALTEQAGAPVVAAIRCDPSHPMVLVAALPPSLPGACARIRSGCLLLTIAVLSLAPATLDLIACAVTIGGPPSRDGLVVIRATTPPEIPAMADEPNTVKLTPRDDASLDIEQVMIDTSAGGATAIVGRADAPVGRSDTLANSPNNAFISGPPMTIAAARLHVG